MDCLILNETFLNGSITDDELFIPDYNFFRFDRNENSGKFGGGGLIVYVHDKYDFDLIVDSETCTPFIESMWLKLSLLNTRPTLINAFCRPPDGNVSHFIESLKEQFTKHVQNPGSDILMLC